MYADWLTAIKQKSLRRQQRDRAPAFGTTNPTIEKFRSSNNLAAASPISKIFLWRGSFTAARQIHKAAAHGLLQSKFE
jgi:hypothetical protein